MIDFAVNFDVQWTVEELSHWMPALKNWRVGRRCSKTSHPMRTAAISKSLMDRRFCSIRSMISGGKGTVHTIKRTVPSICGMIHTPPQQHVCTRLYSRVYLDRVE